MVTYEKVEFEHAWQAAKAVCDGEELYICVEEIISTVNPKMAYEKANQSQAFAFHGKLYRKVKPNWWEKLDGTEENSVLVIVSNRNNMFLSKAVNSIGSVVRLERGDWYISTALTPVQSAKIEQWLKNAKESES
jgi:hypothetical protein